MCGIHGLFWRDDEAIQTMITIANHRGPDGNGKYIDEHVSFGHNLLAITEDAELAKQPWVSERYVMCYNGEIYNYLELKSELEQHGYTFRTESDTEVLFNGLVHFGVDFIKKLDGMFALSFYDKETQTIILARDRIGSKPLYYTFFNGKLAFSSELKSLLSIGVSRKIDYFSINLYRTSGYVPGPKTMFKDISKITPGQILVVNNSNSIIKNDNCHTVPKPVKYHPDSYREHVHESVRRCLMGRREIGLFLSGGLDSSAILHELSSFITPKTFTTRFQSNEHPFNDDADKALRLSKDYKTDHHELLITQQDFADALFETSLCVEEPRANQSMPAYYLLNKEMAKSGIVVTLSGDGGDELITGYPRHLVAKEKLCLDISPCKRWCETTLWQHEKMTYIMSDPALEFCYDRIEKYMNSWLPHTIGDITDGVNQHLYMEVIGHLADDFLIRNDKLGMKFSMEARFPLLADPFRTYALGIPSWKKCNDTEVKRLPKYAYRDYLPDYILNKEKTGWSIPDRWFYVKGSKPTGKVADLINDVLRPSYYQEFAGVFKFKRKDLHYKPTLVIFYLMMWLKEYQALA